MLIQTSNAAPAADGSDDPTKDPGTQPDPTTDPDGSTPTSDEDGTTKPEGQADDGNLDAAAALVRAQSQIRDLSAQLEAEKAKKEQAVRESQNRKQSLQTLREKTGDFTGEIEELRTDLQTKEEQIADLKTKLSRAEAEVTEFRAQQEDRRVELLARIPESARAEFDDPAVFTAARLEKIVATLKQPAAARTPDAEQPAGTGAGSAPTTLGDAIRAEFKAKGVELK